MLRNRCLIAIALSLFVTPVALPQSSTDAKVGDTLHIDIPTKLEKANVVIDFGHAVFAAPHEPFALGDISLLDTDVHDWNAKGQIVMIFHGDAAYIVLNDESYNVKRNITTGNPYKKVLNGLMEKGVQLELCGATRKGKSLG